MDKARWEEVFDDTICNLSHTLARKNKDYTAGSDDPFANFRSSSEVGIDPLLGVLIRILDKVQRLKSFALSGKLSVENETVEDSLMDIMGYACFMIGMLREKDERDEDVAP